MAGIAALDDHAVRLYFRAHRSHLRGHSRRAALVAALSKALTGVEIHSAAEIGAGLKIVHGGGIVVGQNSVMGVNCTLYQGVTLGTRYDIPLGAPFNPAAVEPRLGNGVIAYAGAKIFGPVSVGDGAVIAANAVVLQDVPAGKLAVGMPAQIRELGPDPYEAYRAVGPRLLPAPDKDD